MRSSLNLDCEVWTHQCTEETTGAFILSGILIDPVSIDGEVLGFMD